MLLLDGKISLLDIVFCKFNKMFFILTFCEPDLNSKEIFQKLSSWSLKNLFFIEMIDDNLPYLTFRNQVRQILDQSPYDRVGYSLMTYYAKCNSFSSLSSISSWIYYIITIIQLCIPAFMVENTNIWNTDSVIYKLLRLFAVFYSGSMSSEFEDQVRTSFIIMILIIVAYIFVIYRAKSFEKNKSIGELESHVALAWSKFHAIYLLPILVSGFPFSLHQIMNNSSSFQAYCVALSPILAFLVLKNFHLYACPRIILEDSPVHEWIPLFITAASSGLCFVSVFSSIVVYVNPKVAMIIGFLIAIVQSSTFFVYKLSSTINKRASLIIGSFGMTSVIVSIAQSLNSNFQLYNSEISVGIFIVSFLIIYNIMSYKRHRYIVDTMTLFDELFDNTVESYNGIKEIFKTPYDFIRAIRLSLEYWHPFVARLECFDDAMKIWPNNSTIILTYARILSFFPKKTSQMLSIASLLENNQSSISYLIQFQQISWSRTKGKSIILEESLRNTAQKIDFINRLYSKTWESLIERDSKGFWTELRSLDSHIDQLRSQYFQILFDFSQSKDAWRSYIVFLETVANDEKEMKWAKNRIHSLCSKNSWKDHPSIKMALNLFPVMCEIIDDTNDENDESDTEEEEHDNDDNFDRIAMMELLNNSSIGLYGIKTLLIIAFMGIFLYFFFGFLDVALNSIIRPQNQSFYCVISAVKSIFDILAFSSSVVFLPIYSNRSSLFNSTNQFGISTFQYWNMTKNNVTELAFKAQSSFSQMVQSVSSISFGKMDQLLYYLHQYKFSNDHTLQSFFSRMLLDSNFLIENSNNHEIFNASMYEDLFSNNHELSYVLLKILDSILPIFEKDLSLKDTEFYNSYVNMILVLIICLCFPYLVSVFIVNMQTKAVFESFVSFPIATIRKMMITNKIQDKSFANENRFGKRNLNNSYENSLYLIVLLPCIALTSYIMVTIYDLVYSYPTISKAISNVGKLFAGHHDGFIDYSKTLIDCLLKNGSYDESVLMRGTNYFINSTKHINEILYMSNVLVKDISLSIQNENILHHTSNFVEMIPHMNFLSFSEVLEVKSKVFSDLFELSNQIYISYLTLAYYCTYLLPYQIQDELIIQFNDTTSLYLENKDYIVSLNDYLVPLTIIVFLVLGVFSLSSQSKTLRSTLLLFQKFSPLEITQNYKAFSLLSNGGHRFESTTISIPQSSKILNEIEQGIIVLNRDLEIDSNNRFAQEIFAMPNMMIGENFMEITNDLCFKDLNTSINNRLKGLSIQTNNFAIAKEMNTKFDKEISIVVLFFSNGKLLDEFEASNDIDSIVLLIDDLTQFKVRNSNLIKEQQRVVSILKTVLPEKIINTLLDGSESVSFGLPTITLAEIRVTTPDQQSFDEQFHFLYSAFKHFDTIMTKYPDLTKIRTFNHTYTIGGGVFSKGGRIEKSAADVVFFCSEILNRIHELETIVLNNVVIQIGIHSGGPAIIGVMNLRKPSLQLISPHLSLVKLVKANAEPNTIQITRACYELIFGYGFNVKDLGEHTLKGSKVALYQVL